MSVEQRECANVRCYWCDKIRTREEIRFIDCKPICMKGCRDEYFQSTLPRVAHRSVGFIDKG